jgi:hypothetical protein
MILVRKRFPDGYFLIHNSPYHVLQTPNLVDLANAQRLLIRNLKEILQGPGPLATYPANRNPDLPDDCNEMINSFAHPGLGRSKIAEARQIAHRRGERIGTALIT